MLQETSLEKMTRAYSKAVNAVRPNNKDNEKLLVYARKIHARIKDKHGRKAAYDALDKASDDHYDMNENESAQDLYVVQHSKKPYLAKFHQHVRASSPEDAKKKAQKKLTSDGWQFLSVRKFELKK